MKKLYLYALAVVALFGSASAYGQCPNGLAFPIKYSSGCFVFVTAALPDADILVFSDLENITETAGTTNAEGTGTVFYECGRTITRILLTREDGTVCEIPANRIAAESPLPTPIKLGSFKAVVRDNNKPTLEWTSLLELESSKYIVERSLNGDSYQAIGEIEAAGNSYSTLRYSFTDASLGAQDAYYRLKMVDIDGSFEYSHTVYVNLSKNGSAGALKVFPNPFKSTVQLGGISAADVNRNNIRVYTLTGQQVNFTVSGANAITIDAGVPAGIYILRVKDKTFRLLKEQ